MSNRNPHLKRLAAAGSPWAVIALQKARERRDAALRDGKAASEAEIKERVKLIEDSLRVVKRKDI
jgi:hypothetical protein